MSSTNNKNDKNKKLFLINEEISVSPVLLVNPDGTNVSMPIEEALALAKQRELDLVLINQNPGVVKILDYGKYIYELKKNKGGKKNVVKVKSITVKPNISSHDIEWKAKQAIDWFKSGDKVQFVVKTPGRMADRVDLVNEVYDQFSVLVESHGKSREGLKKISKIQYATYFMPVKK
ncbi:translation initiation factor IF-3 [Mycoplasma haemofelis Ohio2]|uniref:Translation initiation factor IF-3 n=1 Tax=Mycoplasma haemofelis (strain Ohio2) TaxID=859194 RepID=F6FFM2_MYCHI|nr:translation initiation factor IF-3 [Mycoplasma haemofelis Ohio2]